MTGRKISYVNFHGKKYLHFDAVIEALRELTEDGRKVIGLEELIEWLETMEYPEPT